MNELLIDLLAAGAVFIVFVIAYNKWQEFRLRKRTEAAFGSRHDDALLGSRKREPVVKSHERIDPVLAMDDQPGAPEAEQHVGTTPVADPASYEHENAPATVDATPASPASDLPLDARIDAIALLSPPGDETIDADPLIQADWSAYSRTVTCFGESEHGWDGLSAGVPYQRVVVGLQLADRKGPLPGMELAAFSGMLEELSRSQGWYMELASREAILSRAADLDRLCAEVDFQIALDVLAPADHPFAGTRIRALAEANGLQLAADGVFKRCAADGALWFILKNRGATPFSAEHMREFSTRGLTLTLDVPRAPAAAFAAMRALAAALRDTMQASIADEQGHALDEPALDRVGSQLAAIHGRLNASGIAPGSPLALRLFA